MNRISKKLYEQIGLLEFLEFQRRYVQTFLDARFWFIISLTILIFVLVTVFLKGVWIIMKFTISHLSDYRIHLIRSSLLHQNQQKEKF